jgi:putative ABC transport system ATP-binding protein
MSLDPYIRALRLSKTYRLGETIVPALKELNLDISKGEFTALVGSSGSGKTTLLNMFGAIDKPDSGEVWIDGVDVVKLSENEKSDFRNRKIGFVFQNFNLLPVLNVFENTELPLIANPTLDATERHARVMNAVRDVQLEDFIEHIPDKLSGGQRQRVAIARALVTSPSLIIADEPTANLDSKTAHKIIDLMQELNHKHKVTFIFSTHDEKLMGRVSRVVRIADGIIETETRQ